MFGVDEVGMVDVEGAGVDETMGAGGAALNISTFERTDPKPSAKTFQPSKQRLIHRTTNNTLCTPLKKSPPHNTLWPPANIASP